MGGGVDPNARVGDLPAAEKSIVAIARAMAVRCELLVLDEPTAALPETDVARLLAVLRRLRARGIGIVYVTHRLDEVFRFADRVTVLRDGRRVTTEAVADTNPTALIFHIVGRSLADLFVKPPASAAGTLCRPAGRRRRRSGLLRGGGGRDRRPGRLARRRPPSSGGRSSATSRSRPARCRCRGPLPVKAPRDAMRRIGFVSSKRGEESLAPNLTVRENLFINPVITGGRVLPPSVRPEQARCLRVLHRFSVRPPEPERVIATLSGGNQQKVVVARWLEAGSRLLVLEEPTFGVDVGSKAEIYQLLQQALDGGLAVLLISSDFEEVAGICHRALIFDRGRVAAELARAELSLAHLTALAAGGDEKRIEARLA